ncbi:MFS transporter [Brachybacterium sp. J144]|uniref:MFS transporter n=1 Tax=Brachybacterium sp. J144 TaxID=3116487 RepID=UPI002E7A0DA9|nr:MFS transporter [Brachybacterium sp. J144]MEE1651443.1 MFS transporter [Brachybacterium sp. J144]
MFAPLPRWYASYGSFALPQAAAPIAFSLIALPLTGDPASGAAMVLAMTAAQVLGAVPITRLGRGLPPIAVLRTLIAVRTLALVAIALLAGLHAPFALVIAAAALAGLVNGAAYGYLRAALNDLVAADRLPRALGVAATLNEVVFVSAPVLAAALGSSSPQLAAWAMALLGAGPLLLLPRGRRGAVPAERRGGLRWTPRIALWLACAAASGAAIAAIEIGAVSLAVGFGMPAAWGVVFPVALCTTSVLGGIWVSVHNREARPRTVLQWLAVTGAGVAVVGFGGSVAATLLGALLVGAVLAPLATHYSLALDRLVEPAHRAEVFALLRTASALGVITASALISLTSLQVTMLAVTALMAVVLLASALVVAHDALAQQQAAVLPGLEGAEHGDGGASGLVEGEAVEGADPVLAHRG